MSNPNVVKVAIGGSMGRMGQRLCALSIKDKDVKLVGFLEYEGHPLVGTPLYKCMPHIFTQSSDGGNSNNDYIENIKNLTLCGKLAGLKEKPNVLIDFSVPQGTVTYAKDAEKIGGINLVIGTTGLNSEQIEIATGKNITEKLAVVYAMNFSLGVNLISRLVAQASKVLGEDFDIEIVEAHHNRKTDAPSGTAYALADSICAATGRKGRDDLVYGRVGTNKKRTRKEIGMHSLRMGSVVGDHTVHFASDYERIELTHKAQDRDVFAAGAIRAAKWIANKHSGLFNMQDVLNI